MHPSACVQMREGMKNRRHLLKDRFQRHLPHPLVEGVSKDALLHQVGAGIIVNQIQSRDDVGMTQIAKSRELPLDRLASRGAQSFNRHGAIITPAVQRRPDLSLSPLSELLQ